MKTLIVINTDEVYNMKKLNIWKICTILLVAFLLFGAAKEYKRFTNLRVKGWLFSDTSWSGQHTWSDSSATDTIVVAGLTTSDYVFITNVDSNLVAPLTVYTVAGSVFVTSDSTLDSAGTKINWMVLKP